MRGIDITLMMRSKQNAYGMGITKHHCFAGYKSVQQITL
jgi:hypothetical protein